MVDMNTIIGANIYELLKKTGRRQVDLAKSLGVSKQTVSKMLNGGRVISAVELKKIADYLDTDTDSIIKIPEALPDTNIIHTFMGKVNTKEAKKALQIADEVSDLILFHSCVRNNGTRMERKS